MLGTVCEHQGREGEGVQYWRYAMACGRAKPTAKKDPARIVLSKCVRLLVLRFEKRARRDAMASKRKIVPWRRPLLRNRAERAKQRPDRTVQADVGRMWDCWTGKSLCS
jgi:hypothetical protein